MKNIILAGFDGKNNPAHIITEKAELDCTKLILPNDKVKAAELILETIRKTKAVCVVLLGQKPCIKEKIAVEPTAERNGEIMHTALDVTVTAEKIKENGSNYGNGSITSYVTTTHQPKKYNRSRVNLPFKPKSFTQQRYATYL